MKKLKRIEDEKRAKQLQFNEADLNQGRIVELGKIMDNSYYNIKKDLGLIAKCSHGSEFDHDTEHVFNDLRPKSLKGY